MTTEADISGNTTRIPASERVARMARNHSTALLTEVAKGMLETGLYGETGCCQERGANPHSLIR